MDKNTGGTILMVDDNIANLCIGRSLLKDIYRVYLATSGDQMFEMLKTISPDIILMDISMPDMDGFEAIRRLKAEEGLQDIPVIFLTARNDDNSELMAFELGGADYVAKPFSPPLLLKRLEHHMLIVRQQRTIRRQAEYLAEQVREKVGEVTDLQNAVLHTVADLVEFRDRFTGGHIMRTQLYMKAMIDGLLERGIYEEELSGWNMDFLLPSAQLHDVGKIAISDTILNKPAALTETEFEIMKSHVAVGMDAVNRIMQNTTRHDFLRHAMNIVSAHHERWDGTGYPAGLKGGDIPLEGRIMAIADVYDALISSRPYKGRVPPEIAEKIIESESGKHFDPVLVEVFMQVKDEFQRIEREDMAGAGMFESVPPPASRTE